MVHDHYPGSRLRHAWRRFQLHMSMLCHKHTLSSLGKENMTPIKVPNNLPDLVRATFNKAKANGDVNFYPTQVAVLTTASTPVSPPVSLASSLVLLRDLSVEPE